MRQNRTTKANTVRRPPTVQLQRYSGRPARLTALALSRAAIQGTALMSWMAPCGVSSRYDTGVGGRPRCCPYLHVMVLRADVIIAVRPGKFFVCGLCRPPLAWQ